jgi:hypothetical protein
VFQSIIKKGESMKKIITYLFLLCLLIPLTSHSSGFFGSVCPSSSCGLQPLLTYPVTGPGSGATVGDMAGCANTACTILEDLGAPFNPASPGTIGGTTPGIGNFTQVNATSEVIISPDGTRSIVEACNTATYTPGGAEHGTFCQGSTSYVVNNGLVTNESPLLSSTVLSLAGNGATTIFTVPTGKTLLINYAFLVGGSSASTSTLSIGQSGTPTDFINAYVLSGITGAGIAVRLSPVNASTPPAIVAYPAGTVITATVGSHAGGATNTILLFGTLY